MIYGSRGREDMSGLVQSYCPLRVFSFLNLSPSAASTLCGLNGEGAGVKLLCHNGSLNTGPLMETQTDCQTVRHGACNGDPTVSDVGGVLAHEKQHFKTKVLKMVYSTRGTSFTWVS